MTFLHIERVAAERCDRIGGSVGYAVRGETKVIIHGEPC